VAKATLYTIILPGVCLEEKSLCPDKDFALRVRLIYESLFYRPQRRLGSGGDVQFAQDAAHVVAYRFHLDL
jgi:hypothetical protein